MKVLQLLFPAGSKIASECVQGVPVIHSQSALHHLKLQALDAVYSAKAYEDCTHCKTQLHQLKYCRNRTASTAFGSVLTECIQSIPHWQQYTLVPVPLHWTRMLQRTFNQSALLANVAARELHLPLYTGLKRIRATGSQAKRNRAERLHSLKQAFFAKGAVPKYVLLIDDIWTTGTTLNECATALKAAGASQVVGVTVAHAKLN